MNFIEEYITTYLNLISSDPIVLDDRTKMAFSIVLILLGCLLIYIAYQQYQNERLLKKVNL